MWDKDLVDSNELIGETKIYLNLHKMIDKGCKRRKSVKMKMQVIEFRGKSTDELWFDVYHPEIKDELDNPES